MGNGTLSRMLGDGPYYDNYEARRPRLPRTDLDQREDVFYNGPRLRDYDEELDPKSWGDTMKRHITSPYVSDKRWEDKNLPRFNKTDSNLKLYTGTTDTDRLSSASKSRKKKSKKKREEEMLLSYRDTKPDFDSELVSQGTQTATISSNFDDYPTTLPLPVHYRNEKYVTRDIGTQARGDDNNGSVKQKYKKKQSKAQRSYRSIPPDYNDELEKAGLRRDSQGNLKTIYPWEKKSKRRKSVDSDVYSDSDRSRSSTGSRRKAEPVLKEAINEALRNYGTLGKVEAIELKRELKDRPDNERLVKIPRPVASALVKEGSMRYPVPDYADKRKIDVPHLTATRVQLRSLRANSKEYADESAQVPEDTFKRSSAPSPKGWDELQMPDPLSSDAMPEDDAESVLSPLSEKSEAKPPAYDFAEKIKEIYEELKPQRKLIVSTAETQTDYVEPEPISVESELDEPALPTPTPSPEPEPEPVVEPQTPTPTSPPTPPPPKPVMVDAGTDPQPVYEPPIIPEYVQPLYERWIEPVVVVENEPEPTPSEPGSIFAEKEIQADPDDIDNKPKIRIHTAISIQPDAELQDLFPETVEKAIQTGYSRVRNKKLQAAPPVDEYVQTDLMPKLINKKLQADRKPRLFNRGSQASLVSEDLVQPPKVFNEMREGHTDMDGDECHSIASEVSGSSIESIKSENPYQPLSYGPPPPKFPQPKSWGTTAKVENIYSGLDGLIKSHESGGSSPPDSDTHSQGVQTTTTLDTRAASMIRKLGDLESLSGILDLEPEEYASTYGEGEEFPDVVNDTMSVKSGFSLKTL